MDVVDLIGSSLRTLARDTMRFFFFFVIRRDTMRWMAQKSQLNMDCGKAELYCNLSIQDTNVVGLQALQYVYDSPKNKTILLSYNMQISFLLLNPTVNGVCSCRKIFVLELQLIDLSLFWKSYSWHKRSTLRPCDYTLRQWGKKLRPPLFCLQPWLLSSRLEFITFFNVAVPFTTIFFVSHKTSNISLPFSSQFCPILFETWGKWGKRKENGIVTPPQLLYCCILKETPIFP